jgi:hypothetical protein
VPGTEKCIHTLLKCVKRNVKVAAKWQEKVGGKDGEIAENRGLQMSSEKLTTIPVEKFTTQLINSS